MDNSYQNSFPVHKTDKITPPQKNKKNVSVINVGQILLLVILFIIICAQAVNLLFAPAPDITAEPAAPGDSGVIRRSQPEIPEYADEAAEIAAETDVIFILGENNGKLAILSPDRQIIYETFNVYINTLPEFDRNLLIHGIKIKTAEELASLLEDFSS